MTDQDVHTLEQQHQGLQQMFGHVLKEIGTPVEVAKDELRQTLGDKYMIDITETDESFIFSLVAVPTVVDDGQ